MRVRNFVVPVCFAVLSACVVEMAEAPEAEAQAATKSSSLASIAVEVDGVSSGAASAVSGGARRAVASTSAVTGKTVWTPTSDAFHVTLPIADGAHFLEKLLSGSHHDVALYDLDANGKALRKRILNDAVVTAVSLESLQNADDDAASKDPSPTDAVSISIDLLPDGVKVSNGDGSAVKVTSKGAGSYALDVDGIAAKVQTVSGLTWKRSGAVAGGSTGSVQQPEFQLLLSDALDSSKLQSQLNAGQLVDATLTITGGNGGVVLAEQLADIRWTSVSEAPWQKDVSSGGLVIRAKVGAK